MPAAPVIRDFIPPVVGTALALVTTTRIAGQKVNNNIIPKNNESPFMNYKNQVESPLSDNELKTLLIQYFNLHKFILASDMQSKLVFKCGSKIKNLVTFNPLKWKSETIINIENSIVEYECTVDASFQAVTIQEEKVWDTFIANLETTIERGKLSTQNIRAISQDNKRSIRTYILYVILGAVIFGIPSGIISHYTEINLFIFIGPSIGGLLFLFWKMINERNNYQD